MTDLKENVRLTRTQWLVLSVLDRAASAVPAASVAAEVAALDVTRAEARSRLTSTSPASSMGSILRGLAARGLVQAHGNPTSGDRTWSITRAGCAALGAVEDE